VDVGRVREWARVGIFSIFTLFVLPGVFFFGLVALGFDPLAFAPSILEAAMPLGITPFALAEKYDLDKKFIARGIVFSTILAMTSLPVWIFVLI